jgi:iron complex transport system substrate-binding protein
MGYRIKVTYSGRLLLRLALVLIVGIRPLVGRTVTDETGRSVNVPDHPQRLISLAPSVTEIVYALGRGDRLVGDTEYCDYPPEAKRKPHVGAVLNPSLEQIVALKPDLVLGIAEANRRETAEQLDRLGIPLYGLTAHTMDDMLRSVDDLGDLLGREAEAGALIERLQNRIQAVAERVKGRPRPKVLFVVWYQPLVTAGPHTFISDVIRRAGGQSVTDDVREEWPRLSLEEALHRDPDIILFPRSESFAPSLEEFPKLPGWRDFRAVKNSRLYFIPDTIVRPCPRLVDALEEVARVLHPEPAATRLATGAQQ